MSDLKSDNSIKRLFTIKGFPNLAIILIALALLATNFSHHNWTKTDPKRRGVIKWDVISYYSYLPAALIHWDLTLDFMSEPDFTNDNKIWFSKVENGNKLIITSMGLSFMYAPFFLIAHTLAKIFGLTADGYGSIYQFFLIFGGFFYMVLGLVFLKKILLKFFKPEVVAITLILVAIASNLYYYSTYEAAMPHVYNFFLIILFLWQVMRWFSDPNWKNALLTGALLGLISLIRPTNILVFFILLLWEVKNWNDFTARIRFYIQKYYLVLIMLAAFILVWAPQFLYWKMITGKFLYFSYGAEGGAFYFLHPKIFDSLFSFMKGWYIYTPVMFIATMGIVLIRKRIQGAFIPILVLYITMVYVQSSWWSWWFGGGYGLRPYIDIYGIMALPLAAVVDRVLLQKKQIIRYGAGALAVFLVYLSWQQTYQYRHNIIHYSGMNRYVFAKNFMRYKPAPGFWQTLTLPDYRLAREGIYISYYTGADNSYLTDVDREEALKIIIREIADNASLSRQVKRYADRSEKTLDEVQLEVAERIYFRKTDK